MIALIKSCTLVGIDAVPIDVECVAEGKQLPSFNVVGLPAPSVKEGGVRIRSALNAVGHDLPKLKLTVNLAPADLKKQTGSLDLPIAASVLIADKIYQATALEGLLVMGELGLDGTVRAAKGVLAASMLARELKMRGVLVPAACAGEALVVEDLDVFAVSHLSQVIEALAGRAPLPYPTKAPARRRRKIPAAVDMSEVRGQFAAREAIEIAVAGGHNILLAGPPGTGKTMLARRIPTVLPKMTREEALETTKIYSALGLADGLMEERPFRAPHHTISSAALLGGGSVARPGEISLAHNGVLFLDELPEFARMAIEGMRQPLEERTVTIGRIHGTARLPASFLLAAAANPCACGWLGTDIKNCTCSQTAIMRYRSRLSGPLLDRIDLQVYVQPVPLKELRSLQAGEPSAKIRDRVLEARERQHARLRPWGIRTNAEMNSAVLRATCKLDDVCERELANIVENRSKLSARSIDRLIKVARTIADLEGRDEISALCLVYAAQYRPADPADDHLSAAIRAAAWKDDARKQALAGFRRVPDTEETDTTGANEPAVQMADAGIAKPPALPSAPLVELQADMPPLATALPA